MKQMHEMLFLYNDDLEDAIVGENGLKNLYRLGWRLISFHPNQQWMDGTIKHFAVLERPIHAPREIQPGEMPASLPNEPEHLPHEMLAEIQEIARLRNMTGTAWVTQMLGGAIDREWQQLQEEGKVRIREQAPAQHEHPHQVRQDAGGNIEIADKGHFL